MESLSYCQDLNFKIVGFPFSVWDPAWDTGRDPVPKSHIGIPPGIPGGISTKILHGIIINNILIEKDHLSDSSPEKDYCLQLTFRKPVRSHLQSPLTLKMASARR